MLPLPVPLETGSRVQLELQVELRSFKFRQALADITMLVIMMASLRKFHWQLRARLQLGVGPVVRKPPRSPETARG